MTIEAILLALMIFVMRILNYAIGTVRMVAVTRQQRVLASSLAAVEAFVFAVVIANVVTNLEDILNLFAYCAGASVGSYVGMTLESRLIKGFMIVNIFTHFKGHEVALAVRDAGFGVTETRGEGRDGAVTTLRSVAKKREIARMTQLVQGVSPEAFIALEEARGIQRGWMGTARNGKPF
jgi:uncharacterized protein YebE (UPF0316 family)